MNANKRAYFRDLKRIEDVNVKEDVNNFEPLLLSILVVAALPMREVHKCKHEIR